MPKKLNQHQVLSLGLLEEEGDDEAVFQPIKRPRKDKADAEYERGRDSRRKEASRRPAPGRRDDYPDY